MSLIRNSSTGVVNANNRKKIRATTERSHCTTSCEMSGQCPIPGDQGVNAIFKKRYCDNNWTQCARYSLHNHEQTVRIPTWLLPNMAEEAQSLLEQYC